MESKRISNSMIMAMDEVERSSSCPKQFEKMYLTREISRPPSEAMILGQYFEFLVTGYVPREGVPEVEMTQKKEPTAPFKRAIEKADMIKRLMDYYNVEILTAGEIIEIQEEDGTVIKGVTDIVANLNGEKCIIDLKYSGLVGNRWEERGWHEDRFADRVKLWHQAIMYRWLWWKKYGTDIPFYFIVASSGTGSDHLFWKVEGEIESIDKYMTGRISYVKEYCWGENRKFLGWPMVNGIQNCGNCPWMECPKRKTFANIQKFHISLPNS